MLRITLKSIGSNKIRFALTASAVVVGVAFVVASFVVADSLRSTFSQLSSDINEGKDYIVRAELSFGDRNESVAPAVDEDLLAPIRALDGVRDFPSRVKCATLAWHALKSAIHNQNAPVSTE